MQKILVPYDFSDVASHALDFAVQIARKCDDCTVTVMNVIEHPTSDSFRTMGIQGVDPMEEIYINKLIQTVEANMDKLINNDGYKGVTLSSRIVLGSPFRELSEEIAKQKVDLVVMGTHGSSGLQELFVGSNAERMVRYSKCPVITIREEASVAHINKIVFASNFQDVPPSFVYKLKALQRVFEAELKIVKINTPSSFMTTRHDTKQMEDFVAKYDLHNCSIDIYNYSNEEDGIIAYAEDIDADMVAIGTRQRRGVGHFLSGSIAEDVVNHARVPVWTFGLDTEL